jgi:hypothetical protein
MGSEGRFNLSRTIQHEKLRLGGTALRHVLTDYPATGGVFIFVTGVTARVGRALL